ncbi:MAG: DUF6020 family protein, partial [Lachnospiraceae bacterium]|nr:DUF6020 family protein [Lachnospiraceae bacterium]
IFCLLQSFMTIFLLSGSICWIGSRSRIAGYILLFFYGLVPVFPIFSMTMAKDSCLAVAILLYVSMTVRSFGQHDFWLNDRNATLFSLSILLMTLFRNHAGWVPAVAFVLYAVFALKQKKMIIKSFVVFMLVGFFAVFLPAVLRIPPTETKENMTVPLQTMAYYAKTHPEEITDEDKTIISQVIPYEEMISRYDPDISDPIKNIAKFDTDSTGPFIRLWFQKLFRHPGTMASGFYRGIYIYLAPEGYCTIKPHAKIGYDGAQGTKDALGLKNENPNLSTLMEYLDGWLNTPVIHLFVKIGLFSILLEFCLFLIIFFKQGRYMFCIAPLLMVLIGCFLSPVNGYYRYAYSMIIGIPIVFADILVTIGQKAKEKGFHLFVKKGGKSHVSMEK